MKRFLSSAAVIIISSSSLLCSAADPATTTLPVKATATVQAIDPVARKVTFKTEAGQVRTIHVGPNITNLDQVKVGDVIIVTYTEWVAVRQPDVIQELGRDSPVAYPEARYGGDHSMHGVRNGLETIDPATGLVTFVGDKGRAAYTGDLIYTDAVASSIELVPAQ